MKENKIEVVKQDEVIPESSRTNTEGFIRKFEKQVDFYELFEHVERETPERVSYRHCDFCNANAQSLKIDLGKKTFSCDVCGLKGGLVLYLMLRDKAPLKAALRFIAQNTYSTDVTIIPHHVLIP